MRILMVNLIGFSNINYIKHQEWTDMLIEKQGLLSLQSFMPSDSAAQWKAVHFMNNLNTKEAQKGVT
jgi:hypothetical protein